MVKNLPVVQETQVQSLGREDPLEEGMAIHSSILAWRGAWQAAVHRVAKSWMQLSTYACMFFFFIQSLQNKMYTLRLTAHLNTDQPRFMWLIATCG